MIIYNVTTKVNWFIHDEWFAWMKDSHIPDMLQTRLFYKYQMVKLVETDEAEGPTYAVQYYSHNIEDYNLYLEEFSTALRKKTIEKWGDQCVSFRTLMEVV